MKDIKVICGANFGDEGKGLLVDKFAGDSALNNKNCLVVMANGGAQRGHTVSLIDGKEHVFKHFGSGTFAGAHTYFPYYFIINPMEFVKELVELNTIYGIKPVVFSHVDCYWTTPFDMMVNQIVEESRGDKKHGSCGMGIWETITRYSKTVPINMVQFDYFDYDRKVSYLADIRDNYCINRLKENNIFEIPENWRDIYYDNNLIDRFISDVHFFTEYVVYANDFIINKYDTVIFESGQGLLLDGNNTFYGDNTTPSNTGCINAFNILNKVMTADEVAVELCYVTRSYMTRHGAGRFETECDKSIINADMFDFNNKTNQFQGSLRYGSLYVPGLNERIKNDSSRFYTGKFNVKTSVAITHTNEFSVDLTDFKKTDGSLYLSDGKTRDTVKKYL